MRYFKYFFIICFLFSLPAMAQTPNDDARPNGEYQHASKKSSKIKAVNTAVETDLSSYSQEELNEMIKNVVQENNEIKEQRKSLNAERKQLNDRRRQWLKTKKDMGESLLTDDEGQELERLYAELFVKEKNLLNDQKKVFDKRIALLNQSQKNAKNARAQKAEQRRNKDLDEYDTQIEDLIDELEEMKATKLAFDEKVKILTEESKVLTAQKQMLNDNIKLLNADDTGRQRELEDQLEIVTSQLNEMNEKKAEISRQIEHLDSLEKLNKAKQSSLKADKKDAKKAAKAEKAASKADKKNANVHKKKKRALPQKDNQTDKRDHMPSFFDGFESQN